jgi:hypothetical protein
MLFAKRTSPSITTRLIVAISFIVLGSTGCQSLQSRQPPHRQMVPGLKLLSETHAPYIYPVNGEVRGPVADIVRQACKQIKLECLLTMHDGQGPDGFKAIENGEADGILAVEWDAPVFNKFDAIEPLFMEAAQNRLYYLAISKTCDDQIAERFMQALRRVLDHEDAGQIYARYAIRPQVLFPCTLPSRNIPAVLSGDDMTRLQAQSARVFYSSEDFSEMSCAYEQRFMPYGAGIVKDSALRVLWQNWLHPRSLKWHDIPGHLQDLNQENFGGCNAWRLPTAEELYSIYRFGVVGKALPSFWSADKEQLSDNVWTVNFGNGKISPAHPDETLAVIAVCPEINDE